MQEPRVDEPERAVSSAPGVQVGSDPPQRFEEVYLLYAARLRKIAIRNFGIPKSEAETLVHDVFATYITQASSVRAVERYLVGAICNASRHYLRRSDAAEALFCGDTPCAATPSESLLDEVARKLLLGRVLRRIDCRCRELLQRYYLEGETTQAIADELHSTPGSILVTLHKCRKRARDAYRSIAETT
jgi:RNA polymerase sigma factor (sigma-70 family)